MIYNYYPKCEAELDDDLIVRSHDEIVAQCPVIIELIKEIEKLKAKKITAESDLWEISAALYRDIPGKYDYLEIIGKLIKQVERLEQASILPELKKALKPILHALMVFQGIDEISDEQKVCVDMGDTTIIAAGCTVGDLRRIVEVVEELEP